MAECCEPESLLLADVVGPMSRWVAKLGGVQHPSRMFCMPTHADLHATPKASASHKLQSHARTQHSGKIGRSCPACRELMKEVLKCVK